MAVVLHVHQLLSPLADPAIGLYLHVAALLDRGSLPYLAAWEYKPPGLFALFALALRLAPTPTLAVQAIAIGASVAAALAVGRLADVAYGERGSDIGRVAALLALALSVENEGYVGDAEVLVAPFVAWAIVVAASGRVRARGALAIGLLCGAALQMKLSAAPMLAVPAALLLVRSGGARATLRNAGLALAGFLAPVALEVAVYARAGALAALVDANVGATLRRAASLRSGVLVRNEWKFGAQLRVLAPAIELAPLAAAPASFVVVAGWAWLASAVLTVAAMGEFYDRHFALLQAPLALLGALGLGRLGDALRLGTRGRRRGAVACLLLAFALHDYYQVVQGGRDAAARIARRPPAHADRFDVLIERLRARGACGRSLFVVEDSPWLYDVLGSPAPTRFVDADHLLEPQMIRMVGVDAPAELRTILLVRRPALVLVGDVTTPRLDPVMVGLLRRLLAARYRPVERVVGTTIYERRGAACAGPG